MKNNEDSLDKLELLLDDIDVTDTITKFRVLELKSSEKFSSIFGNEESKVSSIMEDVNVILDKWENLRKTSLTRIAIIENKNCSGELMRLISKYTRKN